MFFDVSKDSNKELFSLRWLQTLRISTFRLLNKFYEQAPCFGNERSFLLKDLNEAVSGSKEFPFVRFSTRAFKMVQMSAGHKLEDSSLSKLACSAALPPSLTSLIGLSCECSL